MDVNTSLNLLNAVAGVNQVNQPQNTQNTPGAPQNSGLIGGQSIPQDILDLSGWRPRAEVNMTDINAILQQHRQQVDAFRTMIQQLLLRQGHTATIVDGQTMIEIDDTTRAQAQRDIAEDGYFGVAQTSERILSFARAFAGEDTARIEIMRDAFVAGFRAAENVWGGELPEISQQTFAAVMRGFDEMLGITPEAE
ncbi:MAG: hypothetical protein LBE35_00505 [Clostridiales bacterium]|jgi:hypothetical protein|nr:hypothetical protein [Clostridiales bacterium]